MSASLSRVARTCIFLLSALSLGCVGLRAQLVTAEEKGLPSNSVFHVGDVDAVNLQNGNLHISIPLFRAKQRGGAMMEWKLVYDTPTWVKKWIPQYCPPVNYPILIDNDIESLKQKIKPCSLDGIYAVQQGTSFNSSWRYVTPGKWDVSWTSHDEACPVPVIHPPGSTQSGGSLIEYDEYVYGTNWYVYDPEGTAHPVALRTESYIPNGASSNTTCLGSTIKGPSLDGSGLIYDIKQPDGQTATPTILTNDGTQIMVGRYRDANGNLRSEQSDTLGRPNVSVSYDPNYSPSDPLSRPAYTIYTVSTSSGGSEQYRVDYQNIDQSSGICTQSGFGPIANGQTFSCIERSASIPEISQITLPNGKKYVFTYNLGSPGELARIDLPTGASVSYTYTDFYQIQLGAKYSRPNVVGGRAVASRTVLVNGHQERWQYSPEVGQNTVTDPEGNVQVHQFAEISANVGAQFEQSGSAFETGVVYMDSQGRTLRTVTTDYAAELAAPDQIVANVRPIRITTKLSNGLVSMKETDYEMFPYSAYLSTDTTVATRNNPAEVREFAFGPGSPGQILRRTIYNYLQQQNPIYADLDIVDKPVSVAVYDGSGDQVESTVYEYDNYSAASEPMDASTAVQHDPAFDTSYTTRGNLTAVSKWDSSTGNYVQIARNQYDDAGNLRWTWDASGNATEYVYTDAWGDSSCAPSNGAAKAYPTQVINAKGQSSLTKYNSCTGTIASVTDLNSKTTNYSYGTMNRLVRTDFPDQSWTASCFSDDPNGACQSSTLYSLMTHSGTPRQEYAYADGLGRTTQTQINSGSQSIYVDYAYDGLGRLSSVTNPSYSTTGAGSDKTTYHYYDALNRPTQVVNADGTSRSWEYDGIDSQVAGPVTTAYDEAGVKTASTTDALARLTSVRELGTAANPTNLLTTYGYNLLGNLTSVQQSGVAGETPRTRSFTYDSLSRLLTSTNPEAGTICYGLWSGGSCVNGYDANGNLLHKTDANGTVIDYTYDALNRLTTKISAGAMLAHYSYDGNTDGGGTSLNAIGRLSHVSNDSNAAMTYSYDAMGRVVDQLSCVLETCSAPPTTVHADYDLAGNLTNLKYPDGRTVQTEYDGAGRLATVKQTNGPGGAQQLQSYITALSYQPSGAPYQMTYANGMVEQTTLNSRLQPCDIQITQGTDVLLHKQLLYGAGTSAACDPQPSNNGNIASILDQVEPEKTATFQYDALNRLTQAVRNDGAYNMSYTIDSFGNSLATNNGTGYHPAGFFIDPATNRLQNTQAALTYDAAGRLTANPIGVDAHTYSYDVEGNIKTVDPGSVNSARYMYYPDGSRAAKSGVGGITRYVYFGGQPIAEHSSDGSWSDYVFAGSKRIARADSNTALAIRFTNDSCSGCNGGTSVGGGDRNLVVTSITIDGVSQPLNGPNTSYQDSQGTSYVLYSNGAGYMLESGNIYVMNLATRPTTVSVTAYGQSDYNTFPHMQVLVGGAVVGEWDVTASSQTYDVSSQVEVDFTNDICSGCNGGTPVGGGDRNLYVNSVTINGTIIHPGDPGVAYTYPGIYPNCNNNVVMACNGTMKFTVPGLVNSAWVNAYGTPDYNLYPHMELKLNGTQAGNWDVTASAQDYYALNGSSLHYYFSDHLGTTSLVVNGNGAVESRFESDPYGVEIGSTANDANHYKFTGKERDTESGLDYFGARYYASSMGRWISPDWNVIAQPIPYANLNDPQSLNLYSYAKNNPLNRTDPDGHCDVDGEHHNWLWCGAHALGFTETKKEYQARMDWAAKHPASPSEIAALEAENATVTVIMVGMVGGQNAQLDQEVLSAESSAVEAAEAAAEIPTIGGRKPINSGLAGGRHANGVAFSDQGFPQFGPHSVAEVSIDGLTGNYAKDAAMANRAVGLSSTPEGYVWHHVEDGKTMQLVPQEVHGQVGHTGGGAVIRNGGFDK